MGLVTIVLLIGLLGQINLDIKLHKVVLCIAHVLEESTTILTAVSIKQTLSTNCSPGTTEFSLWSKSCRILQMRKRRLEEANCLIRYSKSVAPSVPRSDFRSCSLDPSFSQVIYICYIWSITAFIGWNYFDRLLDFSPSRLNFSNQFFS